MENIRRVTQRLSFKTFNIWNSDGRRLRTRLEKSIDFQTRGRVDKVLQGADSLLSYDTCAKVLYAPIFDGLIAPKR